MATTWTNTATNLVQKYGPRDKKNLTGETADIGTSALRTVSRIIDYTDLDIAGADTYKGDASFIELPAGAKIGTATLTILTDFAGGTDLTIGTWDLTNGSVEDANGLFTATAGAAANLVGGAVLAGDGAQLGTTITPATAITATENGTFTAGRAVLEVTYEV